MRKRRLKPQVSRAAYTIDEFCDAYRISRAELYRMWTVNTGPRRKPVGAKGTRYIITVEDAEAWQRADTA